MHVFTHERNSQTASRMSDRKECRALVVTRSMQFKCCIASDLSPYPWVLKDTENARNGMEYTSVIYTVSEQMP